MSAVYSWQNFMTYHGGVVGARDCFEIAMEETIQKLYINEQVELVQASRGDGGIDVYKGKIGIEPITVFQCKFFSEKLGESQWTQINESFKRAINNNNFIMKKWVLCLPKILTLDENIKWTKWSNTVFQSSKIEIELWNGTTIINCMKDVGVAKKYFKHSILKYVTNTPSNPPSEFKYRDVDIDMLLKEIEQYNNILIYGLGGIGKSTVAKALYHHIKNDYEYVGWINYKGDLKQDIMSHFLIFEDIQDVNIREKTIENFIIQAEEKMVLFIDNADKKINEDSFLRVLDGSVKLILTSRVKSINNFKSYNLQPINEDNGVDLFKTYYQRDVDDTEDNIRGLVRSINSHTLLIELVAKAALWAEEPLKEFIEHVKLSGFGYTEDELKSEHYSQEATITEHLRRLFELQSLTKEQKRILKNFVIMPHINLPYDFRSWISADKKELMDLINLGWVFKDDTGYSMHPVVKESIRLQESIKFDDCIQLVYSTLSEGFYDVNIGYNQLAIRQEIAEGIISEFPPEIQEATQVVMGELALSYSEGSDFKKAFKHLTKDLELNIKRYGESHKYTARTYFDLTNICLNTYKLEEALEYNIKAEELCRNLFGENSRYLFEIYKCYGIIYTSQQLFSLAMDYYNKCLNTQYNEISEADILSVKFNIGSLEIERRHFKDAKIILEEVLPEAELVWKERKNTMAVVYSNLAIIYSSEENFLKSEKYDKMALSIREELLGEEHLDTATSYFNLANGYFYTNKWDEAEKYLNKAKVIYDKLENDNSESVLKIKYLLDKIAEIKYNF